MTKIEDGGQAFPSFAQVGDVTKYGDGMSLRDWFAGQALAGICGDGIPGLHHKPETTAEMAYLYADAMLAARAASTSPSGTLNEGEGQ